MAPGWETASPRAARAPSERYERQITNPNTAGSAMTMLSMNRMLLLKPAARSPFPEATASLQLSQAKAAPARSVQAPRARAGRRNILNGFIGTS